MCTLALCIGLIGRTTAGCTCCTLTVSVIPSRHGAACARPRRSPRARRRLPARRCGGRAQPRRVRRRARTRRTRRRRRPQPDAHLSQRSRSHLKSPPSRPEARPEDTNATATDAVDEARTARCPAAPSSPPRRPRPPGRRSCPSSARPGPSSRPARRTPEPGPGGFGRAGRPDGHQSPHVEAEPAQALHERRARRRTCSRACGSPLTFTCRRTPAPGAAFGDALPAPGRRPPARGGRRAPNLRAVVRCTAPR